MGISTTILRPIALLDRFLQWSSAVIVMGLDSYFIRHHHGGVHLIYNECIAVISVVFFLPAFISPFVPNILSRFVLLIDIIFSYLWLTAFIFTAQDFQYGDCLAKNPAGVSCSKKRAAESFTWLAFFFTFVGIFLELFNLWSTRRSSSPVEKNGGRAGETTA
ncbi:hypothetical protein VTN96DRAFT_3542 [Rasamsonia emersonii]|uniref:MARVEL domain-containing protein n=1 Tax=Rasamsonia emersonii (strain ATCC 16479 / CBS 393.64 / IMI 116815) TaxID=1408163 RepID=A0A0F4YXG9_RASE3|nr:hypothetical protein T310_3638 [Rasamsonia emersonii CBS 393.64]KKA22308.1 hypothetical protein T310_3638 [Rasamsonia emersonii CBS 393.64]